MITQYKKTSAKWGVVALFTLALLTGCSSITGSKDSTNSNLQTPAAVQNEEDSQTIMELSEDTQGANSSVDSDTSSQTAADVSTGVTSGLGTSTSSSSTSSAEATSESLEAAQTTGGEASFTDLFHLLGLTKEELKKTLNEEPTTVDEGGLEFEKAGIRVWFDTKNNTNVSQVFTQRQDLDFNGAKIGESIEDFKNAFGKPVSDKNGDMHFKYDKGFISVNYDTSTKEVFAVYLLSEDF